MFPSKRKGRDLLSWFGALSLLGVWQCHSLSFHVSSVGSGSLLIDLLGMGQALALHQACNSY